MKEKPIIKVAGGVHVGTSFLKSFRVTWPFGKISFYEDSMVIKIRFIPEFIISFFWSLIRGPRVLGTEEFIQKRIELKFKDIEGFREKKTKGLGHGFSVCHNKKDVQPFLWFWVSEKKAKEIIKFLNSKGFPEKFC